MKISIGAKPFACPTPTWVIGTYDAFGTPNAATIAWGGITSSNPPCINISLRKERYTYINIMEKEAFTVNIPSEAYVREADLCGMISGKDQNKFELTGLTPVKGEKVYAPYIAEFPVVLECRLIHSFDIGVHVQLIGEIVDIKVEKDALDGNGVPDMEKIRPIIYGPEERNYYGIGKVLGKAFSVGNELK